MLIFFDLRLYSLRVTSLRLGSGRSLVIAIVVPSGDTTGPWMKPIHLSLPGGSTSPSRTVVALPPAIGMRMIEGTSIRYLRVWPSLGHVPSIFRVLTKYTADPSSENDGMESLPSSVSCVALPSAWSQMLPALA